MIRSATRLVAPITLEGLMALSVETSSTLLAPYLTAVVATSNVPSTLLRTASRTFVSMRGTCLYAAACTT